MENKQDTETLLAIYDVTGIQEYIFATRWMKENVGASMIVTRMLNVLLPKSIKSVAPEKSTLNWKTETSFKMLDDTTIVAEIIYIGGGNAVVAYRGRGIYNEVNRAFAKALLEQSYTLNLATTAINTSFENYGNDKNKLDENLKRIKAKMLRERLMGALPVVEQEHFHGLPITQIWKNKYVSTLQYLKRQAYDFYREDEESNFVKLEAGKKYAVEIEDLIAEKKKNGYVAIVHIDGNGMGNFVRKRVSEFNDYKKSVPEMRDLSKKVADHFRSVFGEVLQVIPANDQHLVPIRPLIMDGDDVTFVCKGALGVPLTAAFLKILLKKKNPQLSACGGIALVHQNFPFDIAYEIAEACCKNAKKKWRSDGASPEKGYFDFHVVEGAYVHSLQDIRSEGKEERILHRPYCVEAKQGDLKENSFTYLHASMQKMHKKDKNGDFIWPRSWLKKLYEAYKINHEAAGLIKEESRSRSHDFNEFNISKDVFCQLYDALELLELYDGSFIGEFFKGEADDAK